MARPSIQRSVRITNRLSSKILIVHCASKDDDLGAHAVAIGATFEWSFEPKPVWGGTLFWCHLATEDKRLSFVAYEQGKLNRYSYWVVHDDGVYGEQVAITTELLVRPWRRILLDGF
ncbi:unnamed protein product [Linum tenue]|uniref:S-protein homolog n=1 Tax=Linum tenue TaxID=586396 RepID=A0AAV0IBE8_9ROSI|nr:unnamed protein product [Linum tenue]